MEGGVSSASASGVRHASFSVLMCVVRGASLADSDLPAVPRADALVRSTDEVGHDHLGDVSRRQFHLRHLYALSSNGPVFMSRTAFERGFLDECRYYGDVPYGSSG